MKPSGDEQFQSTRGSHLGSQSRRLGHYTMLFPEWDFLDCLQECQPGFSRQKSAGRSCPRYLARNGTLVVARKENINPLANGQIGGGLDSQAVRRDIQGRGRYREFRPSGTCNERDLANVLVARKLPTALRNWYRH